MKSVSLTRLATIALVTGGFALAASSAASTDRVPAPEGAEVYFISPQDGDTVEDER